MRLHGLLMLLVASSLWACGQALEISGVQCPDETVPLSPSNFSSATSGRTYTLAGGAYPMTSRIDLFGGTMCFIGTGASAVTITAPGSNNRHFQLDTTAKLGLQNLTLQGATTGGGIRVPVGGQLGTFGVTFASCSTTASGGAIFAQGARPILSLAETTFVSNRAGGVGGGMALVNADCVLDEVTFINNTAAGIGGALLIEQSSVTALGASVWDGNEAGNRAEGGAVYMFGGTLNVTGTLCAQKNKASNSGGALYVTSESRVLLPQSSSMALNTPDAISTRSQAAVTLRCGGEDVLVPISGLTAVITGPVCGCLLSDNPANGSSPSCSCPQDSLWSSDLCACEREPEPEPSDLQCSFGACCNTTSKLVQPEGTPCRAARACQKEAKCDGQNPTCPTGPPKPNGVHCPWHPLAPRPYYEAAIQQQDSAAVQHSNQPRMVPVSADAAAAHLATTPAYGDNWPECKGKCFNGQCALALHHPKCCYVPHKGYGGAGRKPDHYEPGYGAGRHYAAYEPDYQGAIHIPDYYDPSYGAARHTQEYKPEYAPGYVEGQEAGGKDDAQLSSIQGRWVDRQWYCWN